MDKKIAGLTSTQVKERIEAGLVNTKQKSITKTNAQIIRDNVLTLFNMLNLFIALCLALVGAWSNLLFILIIALNVVIGIYQEMKAKKLVDDLSILIVPEALVIRDGKEQKIPVDEIVQGDTIILSAGEQITCDSEIIDGDLEVNEAMLTGESLPISKGCKDMLYSGSSVISGRCYAKVVHVGKDNYSSKIVSEAQKWKAIQSELLNSMKQVTRVTCFMIVPLGIILFIEAYFLRHGSLNEAVVTSAAGLLGMLPKGLVLLISMSLAAGIVRLSKKRILVQQLYALETLAHVDTLCLDKTGTLTTGEMTVEQQISLTSHIPTDFDKHLKAFLYHTDDNNATFKALDAHFDKEDCYQPVKKIPFSSQRKWSAITFEDRTIVVGAPERLMKNIPDEMMTMIEEGKRLIVIGQTHDPITKNHLGIVQPVYTLVLNDVLRKDVHKVLDQLYEEKTDVKIISGDHVKAVSAIAKYAGVKNYDKAIDMSTVEEQGLDYKDVVQNYTVFGRVTPDQKKIIVETLQAQGHSVGMTGDGVNDILALKQADCSIAIAEGSDAVKQVSQIVLLDSEFTSLPDVLSEGRRVVNNMTRVAGVFFIKTIYSIMVSLICMLANIPFPFIPVQITLIDLLIEGYPAFLTMMEPDYRPVKHRFLPTVLAWAFPKALSITIAVIISQILGHVMGINADHLQTMMYISVVVISMLAVIQSCWPMTLLRGFVCISMIVLFLIAAILFQGLFHLTALTQNELMIAIVVFVVSFVLGQVINYLLRRYHIIKH